MSTRKNIEVSVNWVLEQMEVGGMLCIGDYSKRGNIANSYIRMVEKYRNDFDPRRLREVANRIRHAANTQMQRNAVKIEGRGYVGIYESIVAFIAENNITTVRELSAFDFLVNTETGEVTPTEAENKEENMRRWHALFNYNTIEPWYQFANSIDKRSLVTVENEDGSQENYFAYPYWEATLSGGLLYVTYQWRTYSHRKELINPSSIKEIKNANL